MSDASKPSERSAEDARLDAELALIDELVDEALVPYRRLPPADLARVRAVLVDALATHPNATRLLRQLAPRPPMEHSGEIGDDAPAEDAREAKR